MLYPPLTMVKVLLLEQWYNLSDPQMEEALGDRLSFRRFVGWGCKTTRRIADQPVSDGVGAAGVEPVVWGVGRLEERGLLVKAGTLLDQRWWKPRYGDRRLMRDS